MSVLETGGVPDNELTLIVGTGCFICSGLSPERFINLALNLAVRSHTLVAHLELGDESTVSTHCVTKNLTAYRKLGLQEKGD